MQHRRRRLLIHGSVLRKCRRPHRVSVHRAGRTVRQSDQPNQPRQLVARMNRRRFAQSRPPSWQVHMYALGRCAVSNDGDSRQMCWSKLCLHPHQQIVDANQPHVQGVSQAKTLVAHLMSSRVQNSLCQSHHRRELFFRLRLNR